MVRQEPALRRKEDQCGVFVIYRSFDSFMGLGTVQYTVRGQPSLTRTFEAEIRVEAGESIAARVSITPSEPQKAGPMPHVLRWCPETYIS